MVDSNMLQYCSLDKKKKSLGELEQEFLQALQVNTSYHIVYLASLFTPTSWYLEPNISFAKA